MIEQTSLSRRHILTYIL